MELDAIEFLRRFMLHSLPKGFQRIRYYGLLGSRKKNENIDQIYTSKDQERPEVEIKEITPESFFLELFGININQCPRCNHKSLEPVPLDKHCREGPSIEIP